jgi:hypothetical protein
MSLDHLLAEYASSSSVVLPLEDVDDLSGEGGDVLYKETILIKDFRPTGMGQEIRQL